MPETFTVTGPDGKPIEVPVPKRVRYVCAECGGTNVVADAYARWDEDLQDWLVENRFDKGSQCHDCDGECRIEEVEIEPVVPSYRVAMTVNVLCTASIAVTVKTNSDGVVVRHLAERMARSSGVENWAIDTGAEWDWATLQVESVELVEKPDA